MDSFVAGLLQNWVASFVGAIAGVLFAWFVRHVVDEARFGDWRVLVLKNREKKVDRAISVAKAKEILAEPAELSVFLKGVASPHGWINCDIIQDGEELGLLVKDKRARTWTIDLDRNPQGSEARSSSAGGARG